MTLRNHLDKLTPLYEQNVPQERILEYIRKWLRWVRAVVHEVIDMDRVIGEYLTWVDRLVGQALGDEVRGVVCDGGKVITYNSQF